MCKDDSELFYHAPDAPGSTPMTKPAGSPSDLLLLQAAKLDALFYRTSGEPTAGELMLSVSCVAFASQALHIAHVRICAYAIMCLIAVQAPRTRLTHHGRLPRRHPCRGAPDCCQACRCGGCSGPRCPALR